MINPIGKTSHVRVRSIASWVRIHSKALNKMDNPEKDARDANSDVASEFTQKDGEFSQRLGSIIESFGSTHAFAKKAGVSDTMLRKYLSGSSPGLDNLLLIADAGGVTLDWLARVLVPAKKPLRKNQISVPAKDLVPSDFKLVPRLDVQASAGSGRLSYMEEAVDYLAFQHQWLRSHGVNPDTARILTARGDSMEDTIRDGDILLVDTSFTRVQDNAIYIVVYGDMVLVKRVHGRLNGSLQLISDNPRYPAEEISAGDVDHLHVAGRVMWFGRSI